MPQKTFIRKEEKQVPGFKAGSTCPKHDIFNSDSRAKVIRTLTAHYTWSFQKGLSTPRERTPAEHRGSLEGLHS